MIKNFIISALVSAMLLERTQYDAIEIAFCAFWLVDLVLSVLIFADEKARKKVR